MTHSDLFSGRLFNSGLRLVPVVLATLLLSACATTQAPPPGVPEPERGPDYVPDAGYHLMMGEIALQRKNYLVTAQQYLTAARASDDPEMARRATEFAFNYGYKAHAYSAAARWIELVPADDTAHGYLGVLNLEMGYTDAAFTHLDQSMPPPESRKEGDYLVLENEIAATGNPDDNYAVLEKFARRYPESPGIKLALAKAALKTGDGEVATAYAEEVLLVEPGFNRAEVVRIRGLLVSGQSEEALTEMRALIDRQPDADAELEMELEYSRMLVNAGSGDESLQYLDDMAERYGFVPEIVRVQALIAMDADDQVSAWNSFNKLISAGYNQNESYYYLGSMSEQSRQYLQALRFYSRVRSGYLLVPAQSAIAGVLGTVGDLDAGITHLDEFYEQLPRLGYDVWVAKAGLYAKFWRADDALMAYDKAREYQPYNISLMLGRAAALDAAGRVDESIAAFREALARDPQNPDAQNALGYTLANHGRDLREAEKLIRKAVRQKENNPAYLDSMGWLYFRRGDYGKAEEYLERAYAFDADPEISAHLGELMWAQGREGEANIIWSLALRENPSHKILTETVKRLNGD